MRQGRRGSRTSRNGTSNRNSLDAFLGGGRGGRSDTVTVHAPGKINLSLHVGPRREDGYHSVASIYQAVSLLESVTVRRCENPGLKVHTKFLPGSPLDRLARLSALDGHDSLAEIPSDERNLAGQAAVLMRQLAAEDPENDVDEQTGMELHVVKSVPVSGGMGGGSADAAAALLACDALFNCSMGQAKLLELAATLGADVPFALMGGVAVGLGTGTELTPALAPAGFHWVLVLARFGMSTPKTFAKLDAQREKFAGGSGSKHIPEPSAPAEVLQALRTGDPQELAKHLHNDLQSPALAIAPELNEALAAGRLAGALAAMVSGSGPTVALLCADEDDAELVATTLGQQGYDAVPVTGPVAGARVVS